MKIRKLHIIIFILLIVKLCNVFSQSPLISGWKFRSIPFLTSTAPGYSMEEEKYDVSFYFIDLEVTNQSTFIRGSSSIHAKRVADKIDTFIVELSQKLIVDSVLLQGKIHSAFFHENNLIKIILNDDEKTEIEYRLKVCYQGIAGSGGFYSGISNLTAIPWKQKVTYTLSEPFQGKDWFPVKQNLLDKADSVWVFITVDSTLMAGSNGLLRNISSLAGGKKRFEWKSNFPISYYLISFSVADYTDYSFYAYLNEKDSVLVQNYLYDSPGIDTLKYLVNQTKVLLKLFSENFGTYPFIKEKYGHCMAPMGGGMEHQTMTTISSFDFGLVAHELAHSWFGDYLTCASWQDIWINEGFASYAEYITLQVLKSKEEAVKWLTQAHNLAINFPSGGVFLTAEESRSVQRIFNYSLSYKKGGAIIHMLRYEINNDSLFFSLIRDYLSGFGNSNATGEDFSQIVDKHTGDDFGWFFDQWYYGKGYPNIITSWQQMGDTLWLKSSQSGSANDRPYFKTHMDYRIIYKNGETEDFTVLYEKSEEEFSHPASKEVISVQIDPYSNVLKNAIVYKFTDLTRIFTVNPNPFKNSLNISFANTTKKRDITITGISGKVVYNQTLSSSRSVLDLSHLSPGIYLLHIIEDGSKFTEKIIKQ